MAPPSRWSEMGSLIGLLIFVGVIALGFIVGSARERRHLADLDRREAEVSSMMLLDVKQPPPGIQAAGAALVMGEVVIAADYFKTVAAGIRNLLGGEVRTYQTLLIRARREAKLRMIEEARALHSNLVINVRFEWSTVGPRLPSAEIFCYGTAVIPTGS